ncbi:MAG: hypothetical protein JST53_11305 [Actinobacteria bacterium]|nr:hypothetical protein [Actinomycetota bacterium]
MPSVLRAGADPRRARLGAAAGDADLVIAPPPGDLEGSDLVDYGEIMGRFLGFQCGARYAEAFGVAGAWPCLRAEDTLR